MGVSIRENKPTDTQDVSYTARVYVIRTVPGT